MTGVDGIRRMHGFGAWAERAPYGGAVGLEVERGGVALQSLTNIDGLILGFKQRAFASSNARVR